MTMPKTDLKLSFCIDWLAYTCFRQNVQGWRHIAKAYPDEKWVSCGAHNGYTAAAKNQAGCMLMMNSERPDMGQRAVYSGRVINAYLDAEITPHDIVVHHNLSSDRCGRIDLAIDVFDGKTTPEDYYKRIISGRAKTRSRETPLVQSPTGQTLYIGSRTSDFCMRIYDKALKAGLDSDWKRIELEIKGTRAMKIAKMIMVGTPDEQTQLARGLMLKHVDFCTPQWARIMGDEPIKVAKAKDELPDTEKWLLGQVATSMAKRIHETSNPGLMDEFKRRVDGLLADLRDCEGS